jgi:hypothetical protein
MNGRRLVKEGFLSLETIETWIVYVCNSEGEWARQKIDVPLNGVWKANRFECVKNCNVAGFSHSTVSRVFQEWSPPKGYPANLTQLWEALKST